MRKIIVTEFVTLDGVFEDPGGSEKTPHGGWSLPFWCDDAGKYKLDEVMNAGALLLGRVTYQGFAAAWPTITDESGFADRMNSLPKYVVSSTLAELTWNNSTRLQGDIAAEISQLKQQSGQGILVYGSGALVGLLMQHGLVDEYRHMVHPVVFGSGKRLFADRITPITLKPTEVKTFSSGIVLLTYQPATDTAE
jgi:dihydrofolate reductase